MTEILAHRTIAASTERVASIILNIAELAEWNPALLRTETDDTVAAVGKPYAVATKIPGRATLTYERADADLIVWRLAVAGGIERGEWALERAGGLERSDWGPQRASQSTSVTHTMHQSGPVFALLRNAMTEVPVWRLDRLAARATGVSDG